MNGEEGEDRGQPEVGQAIATDMPEGRGVAGMTMHT